MIQAPNLQYIPAQQPIQASYPLPGANTVQYNQQQTPGVFYNYPTASCYGAQQSASTSKSQFNGVNIEIINPQGQGITPQAAAHSCMPAQFVPVQQPVLMPYPAAQTIVQAPAMPAVQTVAPAPAVTMTEAPAVPQIPAPQIQTVAPQPAAAQTVAPQEQVAQPVIEAAPQAAAPVVEQPLVSANAEQIAQSFAGRLNTEDFNAQKQTIEEIANIVKNDDAMGNDLIDSTVFEALVSIVDKDTSALQGPTQELMELRQKPLEELTADQKAQVSVPTPLEAAEINKQYSLYTISYMQDRLNNAYEKQNGKPLDLKDLPCIENVIDTAKSNPNPVLRVSALASLSHIARPEYKADLTTIFELAQADEDANVKETATKALNLLNGSVEAQKTA